MSGNGWLRGLHDGIVQTVIAMGQRVKILQLDWHGDCETGSPTGPNEMDAALASAGRNGWAVP